MLYGTQTKEKTLILLNLFKDTSLNGLLAWVILNIYEKRLKILNLPCLEYRRLRGDMIEVFKMTHNLYDPATTSSLLTFNIVNTRSHNFKLLKPRVNTKQFQHFFTNRIINNWNNLPKEAVNASSLNCFKNFLDKHFHEHMYSIRFAVV